MRTLSRRQLLRLAVALPSAGLFSRHRALAAPHLNRVKITGIRAMAIKNIAGNCLIRVDTDSGLAGYGEAGATGPMARARIETMKALLIGKDPLAIEVHFQNMTSLMHTYMAHIPTISGIDIALWDLAGKIIGAPVHTLLGGPFRDAIPMYSHGIGLNMLDKDSCRDWAQRIKEMPEGFTAFKNNIDGVLGVPVARFAPTLTTAQLRNVARGYGNCREAVGDDIDIAVRYNSAMPLSRRSFVSAIASPLRSGPRMPPPRKTAAPSKITRIETVYWKSRDDAPFWPHWTWVKIDTDAGISGIGETYPRNPAEAAVVHSVAGSLLGRDPRDIERIWADLYRSLRFSDRRRRRNQGLERHRPGLVGPARQAPERARVPADRGQSESPRPPVQHLFPVQVRFQPRTGKDHARADRDARHQGHQDLAVRRRGGAQPEPVHHPQDIDEALQPVTEAARYLRLGYRDRHRVPRAVERHLRDSHRARAGALPADVARRHADARQLPSVSRAGGPPACR
jgi:L-alanine-DL-glutamate epimerase-like enolase superfamily enzyme